MKEKFSAAEGSDLALARVLTQEEVVSPSTSVQAKTSVTVISNLRTCAPSATGVHHPLMVNCFWVVLQVLPTAWTCTDT